MYSVKIFMQCLLNDIPDGRYEETVLLIDTDSEDDARKKALEYSSELKYKGAKGDNVTWRYVGMYDPQEVSPHDQGSVREIYSRVFDSEKNDLANLKLEMKKKTYNYSEYVMAYADNFIKVNIDSGYQNRISELADKIIAKKADEQHHKIDNRKEKKRFTTGLMGEAALEKLFGIDIIDWSVGDSKKYNYPDIPGYSIGIKTVEEGKFPVIFKDNYYAQMICIKSISDPGTVYICGLATKDVLNKYQDIDLILDADLRARGTKTGFYGFKFLRRIESVDEIKWFRKRSVK